MVAAPEILFEDNHVLAAVKPVNVLSQEDATGDPDMLSILKAWLKEKYDKPGNVFLGLVHRLDRPVGGAMIFAKTSKAASRLADSIRRGDMKKEYLAVAEGSPKQPSARLTDWLLKNESTNIVAVVPAKTPGAKEAILEYTVVESQGALTLLRVNLITGRPHQIRVQLAKAGTPLYGDQKYGRSTPGHQLALWSTSLTLPHPVTRAPFTVTSQPPHEVPWSNFKA